jgi:cytochrome c oxidase subunit 1
MSYVQPLPGVGRLREEASRTCAVTGLRVYAGAQALTLANAVAAVLALAAGGAFGVSMALTRAPSLELLGSKGYYAALTGHGVAALILWPVFFEVAAMVFASTILLNTRVWSMRLGWTSLGLMVVGAGMLLGIIVAGHASVGFTAYPPLVAHPVFYIGYLLFAVGVLLAIVNFAMSIAVARVERTYTGSLPLLTYGVSVAAILALLALVSGLVALIPAWLYSQGWISNIEPIVYRGWFWGLGHTLQYVNVVAMVVAWYGIAALTLKAGPVNQKFTRFGFVLYLLLTVPVLGHHFLVDPSIGTDVKIVGGSLMGFGLGVPSLMHGLAVMGGVEARLRSQGAVTGLFGWLRRIDFRNASIAAMTCSLLLFAIGGWSGTAETTLQLNIVTHNTMWVPAHVHAIVVGGTTLAFMGFAYLLVPLLTQRRLWGGRLATVQAYLYGAGLLALIATQTWAGMLGIPRRVSRVDVAGDPASWRLPMNLMGVAGGIAGLAGALFVVIMVMTILRGKRTDDPAELAVSAELPA